MRMIAAGLNVSLAILALSAYAADRAWNGGGGDVNWSTAANWGGTAPVADDALYFGGSAKLVNTNDLVADTSFSGLTFNSGAGAFALWGNRITLGGNVTNASTSTQTINMPMALSGTRLIYGSNVAITVNGTLSGAGGLVVSMTNSTLTLTGSNTYDGVTVVTNGTVSISNANALGTAAGGTIVNTSQGATLDLRAGITLNEPLTFIGGNVNKNCLFNGTGTNTISSLLTTSGGRHYINGGTALIIAGGITNNPFFVVNGSGTLFVRTTPLTMGTGTFYADDTSLTIIDVASNMWSELTVAKGIVRMNVKNALPPTATIRMGLSYGLLGTLDLNGFDQTTTRLYNGASPGAACILTSPSPATLTINQSLASTTFEGQLTGAVGLCKTGTGTLSLSNVLNSTIGNFTVSNGTLVVTAASSLGTSTNVLIAGGTLELQTGAAIADNACLTVLDGGAKVKIGAGLTETVDRLFLGGVQRDKGTYGATGSGATTLDDAHFSGSGKLSVFSNPPIIPTNYVWDATGTDTYLSNPTNWVGDVAPELGGTSIVNFGTGGGTATVNTNASLYGITFNRDGNFTIANGDGALTLGLGGISAAAPTAAGRTYTLAEDVTLIANQAWGVTNASGGTTLTVSGNIGDGTNTFGFTKIGNGTLVLSGTNTFDGVITNWCGGIQISSSNALGSTAGGTVVNTAGPNSAWLSFYGGITLAEPLTFIGAGANGGCLNNNGGTNTVSSLITTTGGRFVAAGGTVLNITGGMVAPTSPQVVFNAAGTINITTTPLNFGTGIFWTDAGGLTVLGVASNAWSRLTLTGGTLRTDVANALPTNSILQVGGVWYNPGCTFDLNGFNQTVGELSRAEPTPGTIAITSSVPATLTVNQSTVSGYDGAFTGYVSLLKLGTGTLTITNASTSTAGSFVVSNGTLVVGGLAGTLGNNSTNIVVGGTGTLTLQNSNTLSDRATLSIGNH